MKQGSKVNKSLHSAQKHSACQKTPKGTHKKSFYEKSSKKTKIVDKRKKKLSVISKRKVGKYFQTSQGAKPNESGKANIIL